MEGRVCGVPPTPSISSSPRKADFGKEKLVSQQAATGAGNEAGKTTSAHGAGEATGPHAPARHVEHIPVTVYASSAHASRAVSPQIADLIRAKPARGEHAVLGLATRSTPTAVYEELVRMHREERL